MNDQRYYDVQIYAGHPIDWLDLNMCQKTNDVWLAKSIRDNLQGQLPNMRFRIIRVEIEFTPIFDSDLKEMAR